MRKWGTAFEQLEEEAFELFSRLHSFNIAPVGRLTKNEFAGALRLMGADRGKESFDRLLRFMFEAIDLQRTGLFFIAALHVPGLFCLDVPGLFCNCCASCPRPRPTENRPYTCVCVCTYMRAYRPYTCVCMCAYMRAYIEIEI